MAAAARGPGVHKDAGVVAADVVMTSTTHRGSFLLVEGVDEIGFFGPRVHPDCELVDCGGKDFAIGAIQQLDAQRFPRAVAVVDDDFEHLEGRSPPSPNVVAGDVHDLECVLLRSGALHSVLAEYGHTAKIRSFQQQAQTSVHEALVARGRPVGELRWLARRKGWSVDFKRFRASQLVSEQTWQLSHQQLYSDALGWGFPTGLSVSQLIAEVNALPAADPWRVCQGHDLVDILVVGLKQVLGQGKNPGRDGVARVLRQALDSQEFAQTQLYEGLRRWEQSNSPYRVLRP